MGRKRVSHWLAVEAIESGPVGYLLVFAGCIGDVILPVLPSESLVITAGARRPTAASRSG